MVSEESSRVSMKILLLKIQIMSIAFWKDNLKSKLNQFEINSHHPDVFFNKGSKLATIIIFFLKELLYEINIEWSHTSN